MNIATRGRTALSLALLAGLWTATPAAADTFNVTTTADTTQCSGGTCTVRGALLAAQANGTTTVDTINVPAGSYQFNGALVMNSPQVTIAGAGIGQTIFQPVQIGRVLTVDTSDAVVRDVTIQGGFDDPGGNVFVGNTRSATFERVRITGGTSNTNGGGLAIFGATRVDIRASLIDGNQAGASINQRGGGIHVESATSGTTLTIEDTTIFNNTAWGGAGLAVMGNALQPIVLRGVTLARNRALSATGGLWFSAPSPLARIEGSIVAGNFQSATPTGGTPSNCTGSANRATDAGGNLESQADCGLAAAGRQNADPQLAAALAGTVLPIPLTSSAVDIAACGTRVFDQRGITRPQGIACDAGAYEVEQVPVPTPTPTPTPTPPPPVPTPTGTPIATPTPVPTPTVNRSVVVQRTGGTVRVKRPGSSRYADLDATLGIPVGSTVDARKGVVILTSIPKAGAKPESAKFYDGIFKVTQSRGITTLALTEQLAPCSSRARAAQKKKPKTRKLWGDGKGKFRTKGRYAAATVRGTKWLVQDGCRYTLVRVARGSVVVRDEVKRKNIVARKGKRYTARARR